MHNPPVTPPEPSREDVRAEINRLVEEYEAKNGAVELEPIKEYTMEELQAVLGYPISSRNRRKDKK